MTVWALLAVNIASPGPNVLNTITTAMGSGRGPALASALGVALGIGLWCLGMTLGMSALFQAFPAARTLMTLVAAGLLLWFAARFLRAAWRGFHRRVGTLSGETGLSFRMAFFRSLAVNATNPKALTTWVVILSLFPVARANAVDVATLGVGASAIGFLIHALYGVAFSTAPAARAYLRLAPVINAAVGLFFAGFAIRLLAGLAP
ncbi:MAG: LysE family translocator [Paracoccaceae bacterium]